MAFIPFLSGRHRNEPANGTATIVPAEPPSVKAVTRKDHFYGYPGFKKEEPKHSVSATGTVSGNISEAFNLCRDWSEAAKMWNITLDSMTPTTVNGGADSIGDVRHFRENGRSNSEVLLHVDKLRQRVVYGLTETSVPAITAAVTTIDLDPVSDSQGQFKVTIASQYQTGLPYPSLVSQVKAGQKAAFNAIITALKKCFNPEIGMLTVSFLSGTLDVKCPNYLTVRTSRSGKQIMSINRCGTPTLDETFAFELMDEEEQLLLMAYHDNWFSSDKSLASGFVAVKDLVDGDIQVPMKDSDGNVVGEYQLHVDVDIYDAPTLDKASAIGSLALLVFEDFQSKFVEIAVNAAGKDPTVAETWEYDSYPSALGPLPKFCKVLPANSIILPHRVGQLMQRNTEYIYSQLPLLGFQPTLSQLLKDPKSVDPAVATAIMKQGKHLMDDPFMMAYRMWVPTPETMIENLKASVDVSDMETAAQFIRGVNPMKIAVAKPDDIHADLCHLKDPNGRGIMELAAEKSLFYSDYEELMVGKYNEKKGCYFNRASVPGGLGKAATTYWYAPRVVLFKHPNHKLDILGFTLTRFTDRPNVVYTKETTPPNLYNLAKMQLTCADNQHHQFISHLGFAHLAMEVFAVANNNAFPPGPKRHPIGKLLHPHFQDTIGINFLARQTHVSTVAPFMDATFSPGTTNAMKIFSGAYKNWDFLGGNFENDLKRRGFTEDYGDGLPDYHYRDDGFHVWNAYKKHFGRIVAKLYKNDAAVKADSVLQGWCMELRNPARGDMVSFPAALDSRKLLVDCLTTIAFYCSAQHAAVNFSQLRYVSYVPNRPDSMRTPMPDELGGDISVDRIYSALPTTSNTEFQALFAYLLSTPPDNPLDTYTATMEDFPLETRMFLDELKFVHDGITGRNEKLAEAGDVIYEFLDPYQIPQSINI